MGVDCNIWLPCRIRVKDVATVMSILAGNKPSKQELSNDEEPWAVRVEGATTSSYNYPGLETCVRITLQVPGENFQREVMYHHETESGERLLSPRSTPFWLAIGSGLIRFFGGRLEYTDYDDTIDEGCTVDYPTNPENNDSWQEFQERMFNLKPLSKVQIKAYKKHAAYPDA